MALHKTTKTPRTNNQQFAEAPPQKVKRPKRRVGCKGWLLRFVLFGILGLIFAAIAFYVIQPKYYRILVIGSDQRNVEHARSDSLLLVSIPKSGGKPISMIMIPRDTFIDDEERGMQKITHYYAMWDENTEILGNKELTTETVENLLDIKVHGTVEVTFDSFTDVVDIVGGVTTEDGEFTGAEAKELVHNRMNKADGDFGRAAAQRDVLMAVLPKLKNPATAKAVYDYIESSDRTRVDVSKPGLLAFGVAYMIGHKFNPDITNIEEIELPGSSARIYTPSFGKELYYWQLDEAGTQEILDEFSR